MVVIFTNDLEEFVFSMHAHHQCDEMIVLSGYIGPTPVERLTHLPISTKVIYGMYPEELIHERLHDILCGLHVTNHEIYYSNIPVHSKVYLLRRAGVTIYALSGSANFTMRGLNINGREILSEITGANLLQLNDYVERILLNATQCINIASTGGIVRHGFSAFSTPTEVCEMVLYDPATGQTQQSSGLNWGFGVGNTTLGDACIPIRADHIRSFSNLFPPKVGIQGNQPVELIWDDGVVMSGLLEGSQTINNIRYPKQISSFGDKSILGAYMRRRLGLSPTAQISRAHLTNYGRDTVDISLIRNGVYYLDFSI